MAAHAYSTIHIKLFTLFYTFLKIIKKAPNLGF